MLKAPIRLPKQLGLFLKSSAMDELFLYLQIPQYMVILDRQITQQVLLFLTVMLPKINSDSSKQSVVTFATMRLDCLFL